MKLVKFVPFDLTLNPLGDFDMGSSNLKMKRPGNLKSRFHNESYKNSKGGLEKIAPEKVSSEHLFKK